MIRTLLDLVAYEVSLHEGPEDLWDRVARRVEEGGAALLWDRLLVAETLRLREDAGRALLALVREGRRAELSSALANRVGLPDRGVRAVSEQAGRATVACSCGRSFPFFSSEAPGTCPACGHRVHGIDLLRATAIPPIQTEDVTPAQAGAGVDETATMAAPPPFGSDVDEDEVETRQVVDSDPEGEAGGRWWEATEQLPGGAQVRSWDLGAPSPRQEASEEVTTDIRYRVLGGLGQGGMGEVLEALDLDLGRSVALKTLRRERADAAAARRFEVEATVTGQLSHPGIIPIHAMGRDADGMPYYAMRLVRGQALSDIVDSRPVADLVEIFLKVLDTLAYAHSRRVIHRDIKPSNIMVGEFGEVLVVDWGLARVDDKEPEDMRITREGSVMGTPGYMPPEQMNGELEAMGPRSDVFSLGALLYRMLSGKRPLPGQLIKAQYVLDAKGIAPPETVAGGDRIVPVELSAIAMKALAPEPEDRYEDAAAMASDVRRYVEGRMIEARQYTLAERVRRFLWKHRFRLAVTGLLLLATTIGVVVTWQTLKARALKKARNEADALWVEARGYVSTAEEQTGDQREESLIQAIDAYRRSLDRHVQSAVRREAREVARELESVAREKGAWALARMAIQAAEDFGLPAPEAEVAREELEQARTARVRAEQKKVRGFIERFRSGNLGEGEPDDLFLQTIAMPGRHTVDLLLPLLEEDRELLRSYAIRSLGRLGDRRAVEPLIEHLVDDRESFELRVQAANALAALGAARAEPILRRVREGFGNPSRFWSRTRFAARKLAHTSLEGEEEREAPEALKALKDRGVRQYQAGQYEAAVSTFTKVLRMERSAWAYGYRGVSYRRSGRPEAGLDDLHRAVELEPTAPRHWLNRGLSRFQLGDNKGALSDYSKALQLDPGYVAAYTNRGSLWAAQRKWDKAVADYSEALRHAPDDVNCRVNRGWARYKKGEVDLALEDYSRALKLAPEDKRAWFGRGVTHMAKGDLEKAVEDLSACVRLDPDYDVGWVFRARVHRELGQLDEALYDMDQAIAANPKIVSWWTRRAELHGQKGNYEKAIRDCTRAIELTSRPGPIYLQRGLLWQQRKEPDRAIRDLERFLKLVPNHSKAEGARRLLEQLKR